MSDNYKRILTDLYKLYNPDKMSEVEGLLTRYKGREREMIYKIHMKYGSPETRRDAEEKLEKWKARQSRKGAAELVLNTQPEPIPEPVAPIRVGTRLNWRRIGLLLLILGALGGLSYAAWRYSKGDFNLTLSGTPDTTTPDPRYVLANAVLARTTCNGSDRSEDVLHYGNALLDYQVEGECLVVASDSGKRYYPAQYFVPEEVYREIDAIFGNDQARAQIKHSYEKRALRVWFRKNGVIGALNREWKARIAGPDRNPEVWQVFAEDEPSSLNAWARGNFSRPGAQAGGTVPDDLACIITAGANPSLQKLLLFSFDKRQEVRISPAFDLKAYPDRLVRDFPQEGDNWSRFFRRESDYPNTSGILLEDPAGIRPDYLLTLKGERIAVTEEIPKDTIRIPGLPPIIL